MPVRMVYDYPDLPKKRHLLVADVAQFLRVSQKTVRRWRRAGLIKGVWLNGSLRIDRKSLLEFIYPTERDEAGIRTLWRHYMRRIKVGERWRKICLGDEAARQGAIGIKECSMSKIQIAAFRWQSIEPHGASHTDKVRCPACGPLPTPAGNRGLLCVSVHVS